MTSTNGIQHLLTVPWGSSRAHLVGICGAGMKALAEFLLDCGWIISGCDADPDPGIIRSLARSGIPVQPGHSELHLEPRPEVLIYSPAVRAEHPERLFAASLGILQFSYVEALAQLTRHLRGVAIAGTHGKSTTTAMLGHLLRHAGRSPSMICGAESLGIGRSGCAGAEQTLLVEACEFRRHFLQLQPQVACLLGIEPDHFDCYPTLADLEAAFHQFVVNLGTTGQLIMRSDCAATRRSVQGLSVNCETFSVGDSQADWQARDRRSGSTGMVFRISHRGSTSPEVQLQVPGVHNVQNSLAAAACAGTLGLSLDEIAAGLTSFPGLKRRFEIVGVWRESIIIDDYAHHPTEIQSTLRAARERFPGKRLICLFQPHQLSRTQALLNEFAEALSLADKTYVFPVYAAREMEGEQQVGLSQELICRMGVPGGLISALDRVWDTVQTDAGEDAVILTLGAGNLSRIHYEHVD